MLLQLLSHKVFHGYIELLIQGIAAQLDYVHPIVQRPGYAGGVVGGSDEKHLAQVKGHIDIVVGKLAVLFRVQHLQKRGGRVTLEVGPKLVYLVQQQQRIVDPGLLDRVYDPSGHRAHIGLSVPHYLRLIADAAKRHSHILPPCSLSDGAGDGGHTYAGRAHQTNDLAGLGRRQCSHCQSLDKALLDLHHTIVVTVQYPLGSLQVEFFLGGFFPRQFQTGVQVHAYNACLVGAVGHTVKLVALLQKLFLTDLGQPKRYDLIFYFVGLLLGVVVLTKFVCNCAQLLL